MIRIFWIYKIDGILIADTGCKVHQCRPFGKLRAKHGR